MTWQPIETAPSETVVITYGAGGVRFMRKDRQGQWRNMMHRPRNPPTHWMPLPDAPMANPASRDIGAFDQAPGE